VTAAHANDGQWECRCGRANARNDARCPACGIIHVRVSQLEGLRYWRDQEDSTLDDLLARLRGDGPETDQMQAGRALAKFFEHADDNAYGEAHVDGWSFSFEVDAEFTRPAHRELEGSIVIETPSGPVLLTGHCDGLAWRAVRDQKLTERWDAERYLDSLQWRAYLVLFDATSFTYDVFVGRYQRRDTRTRFDPAGQDAWEEPGRMVTITEYHPMTFYAYPDMRRDVERAVAELAAIIVRHLGGANSRAA